jgi:hypothetical protein
MATNAKKPAAAGPATRGLRVICKRENFRRAGIDWSGTQTVPLDKLTPDQVEMLKAESMLVVDEVDIEPAKAEPAKT